MFLSPGRAVTWLLCWLSIVRSDVSAASGKPNILVILTDDQDDHMQSLEYMPYLHELVQKKGRTYTNHFCTVALCCPSRVNLWTGRAAHNTNITDIFHPYGGYPRIVEQGIDRNMLPHWLQNAGYSTYYTGKMWNMHTIQNYNSPPQSGYDGSAFLLDPFTYNYWNPRISHNGEEPVNYAGNYSTDLINVKAKELLQQALASGKPWFLTAAPIAPHSDVMIAPPIFEVSPPPYPERHAHLFKDYQIPRTPNFNPDKASGVGWVKELEKFDETAIEYFDEYQRARLRSLQSVDEMVRDLIEILEENDVLDETYIFYTTDNGFHIAQHRLAPGKQCGYETDIHIPMLVRGPGVPAGEVYDGVTSHTDVAPTIMKLAGAEQREDFDGIPFPVTNDDLDAGDHDHIHEHVNIEHWGVASPEGKYGKYGDYNRFGNKTGTATARNTYKGLRLQSDAFGLYYSVWCHGEKELYDLKHDPFQINNLMEDGVVSLTSSHKIGDRPLEEVVNRLDALLMVLKTCKAHSCAKPWEQLHPKGDVKSFKDALMPELDAFYSGQPKVSFQSCEMGYIKELESPHDVHMFIDEAYIGHQDRDEL